MSDKRPWINPCGLNVADGKCIKKRRHSLVNIPTTETIEKGITAILKQLEDLKIFMKSMFKVNEDTLESHSYAFLNPPENIENAYLRAYHILQTSVMAIGELIKERKMQSDKKGENYSTHLNDIKGNLMPLLCDVHTILISEELCFIDVSEDLMSEQFKNKKGSLKIEKHFIAFRQIGNNMKLLLREFKKMKTTPKDVLKEQNGTPREGLKLENDVFNEEFEFQNGTLEDNLKLQNSHSKQELELQNNHPKELKLVNGAPKEVLKVKNGAAKEELKS